MFLKKKWKVHKMLLLMQKFYCSPIQFLTSGAGSKAWRGDVKELNRDVKFFYDGQGFMSVQLSQTEAEIQFYDVFGNVLHRWSKSKLLYQSI